MCAEQKGESKENPQRKPVTLLPGHASILGFLSFVFPPRRQHDLKRKLLERLSEEGYTTGEGNFQKSWGNLA